jgi:hypothetical protein
MEIPFLSYVGMFREFAACLYSRDMSRDSGVIAALLKLS